jgi:hypothetical protein
MERFHLWEHDMMVRLASVGLLSCLVLVGCGPGYTGATVEGTVTVDGQPLQTGTISFTPFEAGSGTGVSTEVNNGRYTATGVPIGRVRVLFVAFEETGKMVTDSDTGQQYPETIHLVPERYMTTGVEITVTEGTQTQDFELTS